MQVRNFPKLTEEEMPNPEADIEIVPQLEHCKSRHHNVWLGESTREPTSWLYLSENG